VRKRETYGSLKRMVLAKIERNGNSAERGEKKIGEKRKKVRKEKCEKNNMLAFIQKKMRYRLLIFLTCLCFYLCIRRHVLTLMNLILVFLVFFFLIEGF
jgi:Flp pilus assembly protein TadB